MADNIPNVKLPSDEWADLYLETGIVVGTQIEVQNVGAAQNAPTDPVQIDAAGNITINRADQYNIRLFLEYGRTNAGDAAVMIFRIMVNGIQHGDSQYAKLDNADSAFSTQFSGPINLAQGDVLTFQIIRDGSGFNDGSLYPLVPSLGTVNPAPSALVTISRNRLVQPI